MVGREQRLLENQFCREDKGGGEGGVILVSADLKDDLIAPRKVGLSSAI